MSMTGRLVIRAMFACTRAIINAIFASSTEQAYWINRICAELDKAEEEIMK